MWDHTYCHPTQVTQLAFSSSSSGACLRRRSRCHEFPPSRSVLSASLRSRQSKIHRLQVGLHGSEPGLPWTTNPPSPVVRWARNAGLESSVMILSGVGSVEMSSEGQTTAADSVWQKWLPSAGAYLIICDKLASGVENRQHLRNG